MQSTSWLQHPALFINSPLPRPIGTWTYIHPSLFLSFCVFTQSDVCICPNYGLVNYEICAAVFAATLSRCNDFCSPLIVNADRPTVRGI